MGYQYDSIRYGARLLAPLAHQELRNITAVHTCYGTPATALLLRQVLGERQIYVHSCSLTVKLYWLKGQHYFVCQIIPAILFVILAPQQPPSIVYYSIPPNGKNVFLI